MDTLITAISRVPYSKANKIYQMKNEQTTDGAGENDTEHIYH